jgi:hypothetical protein
MWSLQYFINLAGSFVEMKDKNLNTIILSVLLGK